MDTGLISSDLTKIYTAAQISAGLAPALGTIQAGANGCEYILLKGVASTAVGDIVTYNSYSGVTVRGVANGIGHVGFAMAANTAATTYSWYQIKGRATANVLTGFAADKAVYLTATAGSVDDAAVSGDLVANCTSVTAIATPAAGQAYLDIQYPYCTDSLS